MTRPALDAEFERAMAAVETDTADWVHDDPATLRQAYNTARGALAGDEAAGCRIAPFDWNGLRGLSFQPAEQAPGLPVILYFHGGSWCVGSPETHRVLCSHLAAMSGCVLHSVDYRLAPEHPFPAQREDGLRAVRALLEGGARRIVLAGDSAGAAVAFWTEAALDPGARERIAGMLGLYGGYGLIPVGAADAGDTTGLSKASLIAAYRRLGPLDALRAAPGFAIPDAVGPHGPPVFLSVGSADPLLGDSRRLKARLDSEGRRATLDLCDGLDHGFAHYVARVRAARDALQRAADWIVSLG